MDEIKILLPETLYVLRDKPNQSIKTDAEEYNIYFRNILFPYVPEYDVVVNCKYGRNYGDRWCIAEFPYDEDSFPLEIVLYDAWGRRKTAKTVTVQLLNKKLPLTQQKVLCIGDSMTRSQVYMEHIAMKLYNVRFVGTRSYNGTICHEGRGGWSFPTYFNNKEDSPFQFPQNVPGRTYAGSEEFLNKVADPHHDNYSYDGFVPHTIQPGETFLRGGKLFERRAEGDVLVDDSPVLDFDFPRYMERHPECTPDVISILMGANDQGSCPYELAEERTAQFMANFAKALASIRAWSKDVPVVINLPIAGGDQYSWGKQVGCAHGAKRYDHIIKCFCEALLKEYDGKEAENIYISPMLAVLDPVYGFPREVHKANRYSDASVEAHGNWVHPAACGYKQMGDALAAVLEKLR